MFFEIGGINKRIWAGRCRNSIDFFHPCFFLASTPLALQGRETLLSLSARLPLMLWPGGGLTLHSGRFVRSDFSPQGRYHCRALPASVDTGRGSATNRVALFGGLCFSNHPDGRVATAACFALSSRILDHAVTDKVHTAWPLSRWVHLQSDLDLFVCASRVTTACDEIVNPTLQRPGRRRDLLRSRTRRWRVALKRRVGPIDQSVEFKFHCTLMIQNGTSSVAGGAGAGAGAATGAGAGVATLPPSRSNRVAMSPSFLISALRGNWMWKLS